MADTIRLPAFAKINLSLRILGRRPDGYHELRTILQAIALQDTLELSRVRRPGIFMETDVPDLPVGPENLVFRALDALGTELKLRGGIRVKLTKRIPMAAGLGGGSSDAAAALIGLLRLTKAKVALPRLLEIAGGLGADVPFFLFGGRALGISRGHEIYPLPDGKKRAVLVVYPRGIRVSTPEAYRWASLALTKGSVASKIWGFCALCWSPQEGGVANDFEGVVFQRYSRLGTIKRELLERGAEEAALAGSGSAVFGIFSNPAQARRTARMFPDDQVFVTETLSSEECARALHWRPAG
jgi:4-diphosphocytidyl-2-C-methyl-D-erythritol kinase